MWCDPKYHYLYCKKNLPDNLLPRCPLLDKVFNDPATSFDDIYYPPNFTKPPQPESHKEYKVVAIRQLINVLDWWVKENVADPTLLCFYAYSYGPCKLRAIAAGCGNTINDLITEFNYSHPKIAAEIENRWNNLVNKATEWDKLARDKQKSQNWIDPYLLNPVEVKDAANALLNKLRHIVSIVKEGQEASGKAGNNNRIKRWTVDLANQAILSIARKYGKEPLKLTARFLEQETGCPKSTIQKTENWKALQEIKEKYRKERGKMQKKPAHLSDKMLSVAEEMENGTVRLHTSNKKKNIEGDE